MPQTQWKPQDAVPPKIKHLLTTADPVNNMLAFLQIIRLLKTQPRTGWVDRGIPVEKTESIADHMYRMSVLAMAVPPEKANIDKCVKIAVVHDIAESLVGDITPFGGVSKEEKHRRELETIEYLLEIVRPYNLRFSADLKELWLDYEEIRCVEACYVKDIDKFEMIQQAWDYEQEYGLKYDLSEFYRSRSRIQTEEIGALCDEVIRQREAYMRELKLEAASAP